MAMTMAGSVETRGAGGLLGSAARQERGEVFPESRVADRGGTHALDGDPVARGEPGDRAEHRDAVIAVRVDGAAAQATGAEDSHAVLERLRVAPQGRQRLAGGGDAVGLLATQLGGVTDRGLPLG